jgi:uncharacterized RDD family membrane protein YckC
LTSRWARLWGALIDACTNIIAVLPMAIGALDHQFPAGSGASLDNLLAIGTPFYITVALGACVFAVQAVLITRRGQSIGKIIVRTRILRTDGTPAGFLRGVLLRNWLFAAVQMAPLPEAVLSTIAIVNVLFIFGKDRRYLHDWLAGTHVVQTFG